MRVLIVDGDEEFLKVAQGYLLHHGHEARIASNGLECASELCCHAPDVVVLHRELLWGGSDGVRAVMQEVPAWSEIPVILTSDEVWPDESSSSASPSLAAQLQKPYRLEDLMGQLQACSLDKYAKSCAE